MFENKFHQDWINYGISVDSLKKFNIGFYPRCNQITIPVYYNSDLIGIRVRALDEKDIEKLIKNPLKNLPNMYIIDTEAEIALTYERRMGRC